MLRGNVSASFDRIRTRPGIEIKDRGYKSGARDVDDVQTSIPVKLIAAADPVHRHNVSGIIIIRS
jgi:hypothetical protein